MIKLPGEIMSCMASLNLLSPAVFFHSYNSYNHFRIKNLKIFIGTMLRLVKIIIIRGRPHQIISEIIKKFGNIYVKHFML